MKITPQLHNAILYLIIGFLFFFLLMQNKGYETSEMLRQQNDSIISSLKHESQVKDSLLRHRINRLIEVRKIEKRADSLNHYKYTHVKKNICNLTPDNRNKLRDSIFKSNGL